MTGRTVDGTGTAREQEAFAAVLGMDFVFVGQVVANGGHMKIAGLNQSFHRFGKRRLHALRPPPGSAAPRGAAVSGGIPVLDCRPRPGRAAVPSRAAGAARTAVPARTALAAATRVPGAA